MNLLPTIESEKKTTLDVREFKQRRILTQNKKKKKRNFNKFDYTQEPQRFAKTRGVARPGSFHGRFFKRNSVATVVPACCIGSARTYDRLRIKRDDIFCRGIFVPPEPSRIKPASDISLAFSLFWKVGCIRPTYTYSMLYQRSYRQPHLRLFLLHGFLSAFPLSPYLVSRCVVCPPYLLPQRIEPYSRHIRNALTAERSRYGSKWISITCGTPRIRTVLAERDFSLTGITNIHFIYIYRCCYPLHGKHFFRLEFCFRSRSTSIGRGSNNKNENEGKEEYPGSSQSDDRFRFRHRNCSGVTVFAIDSKIAGPLKKLL